MRAPYTDMFFLGEPGDKAVTKPGKALYNSTGYAKLPCCVRLRLSLHIVKGVKEENSLLEMAHDGQKWIGQDGKGFPGTIWCLAAITLDVDQLLLMGMCSLVGTVANNKGGCTMWAANRMFALAGTGMF